MKTFGFFERYAQSELYKDYDEASRAVEAFLKSNQGELIALDLSGITFLGFSYAKATIVQAVRLASSGLVSGVRVVVIAEPALSLDELTAAVERADLAVITLRPACKGVGEGKIIGRLPEHLRDTWALLAKLGSATTAEVASELGETLQNTNQRLRKLDQHGLIRREKVMSPTGGWEWLNKLP